MANWKSGLCEVQMDSIKCFGFTKRSWKSYGGILGIPMLSNLCSLQTCFRLEGTNSSSSSDQNIDHCWPQFAIVGNTHIFIKKDKYLRKVVVFSE